MHVAGSMMLANASSTVSLFPFVVMGWNRLWRTAAHHGPTVHPTDDKTGVNQWWNKEVLEETPHTVTSSSTNLTRTASGSNPRFRGGSRLQTA